MNHRANHRGADRRPSLRLTLRHLLRALGLLLAAVLPAGANAPDDAALERLAAGQDWLGRQRPGEAWREFSLAADQADSNYLSIEALGRLVGLAPEGSRERASAVGRLGVVFGATPPRWLSESTRTVVQQWLADRAATGAFPEQQPAADPLATDFATLSTGLGFRGKRYAWIAPLAGIPAPVDELLVDGSPIQRNDPDRLPEPRLALPGGRWALTDPRHADRRTSEAEQAAWRFDRMLAGYTYEALVDQPVLRDPTRTVTVPMARWYPDQQAIWQLRFRVFYPSAALAQADYYPLAQRLLQTLLQGHHLAAEMLGRRAVDARGNDQVIDVWLTPQTAAALAGGGGETWLNNLYFYAIDRGRAPLEWIREALHEYGHVMMPKIGRYTAAESHEIWLEGYLGERLLMGWTHELLAARPGAELPDWQRDVAGGPAWDQYARDFLEAPVNYWLQLGPGAAERGALDDRGAAWLLGFGQWLAAAHEPRFVYDFFAGMAPNAQYTWQSFERQYQTQIAASRGFRLRASAPGRAVTSEPAVVRDGLRYLNRDSGVEFPLWLASGPWTLRLLSQGSAAATLALGDQPDTITESGPDARRAPAWRIPAESGWYRVRIKGFGPDELALRELLLTRGR